MTSTPRTRMPSAPDFDGLTGRFDAIENRVETSERKLEAHVARVDSKIDGLTSKVSDLTVQYAVSQASAKSDTNKRIISKLDISTYVIGRH